MWKTILINIGIGDVAKGVGVSLSTVKMWVYSNYLPSRYKIPSLCELVKQHKPDLVEEFKESISKAYLGE
jgi:hypothetical protein